jgi:hypothetical protein
MRRLPARPAWRPERRVRSSHHGVVYACLRGRWYGAWYEVSVGALVVTSGRAMLYARQLAGLPARFEALLLLCKLARADAPGMICRAAP